MGKWQRICAECGEPFETTHPTRKFCYKDHYRTCKICGKSFFVPSNKLSFNICTCSEECRRAAISKAEIYKQPRFVCVCSICGNQFLGVSPNSRVCPAPHLIKCAVCGQEFEPSHQQLLSGTRTCSPECTNKLRTTTFMENVDAHVAKARSTLLARYGTSIAIHAPGALAKARATSLSKYGKSSFTQTEEFKLKSMTTNRERYGADWHTQTDEHKEAVKQTCLAKYGVDNPGKHGAFIVDKMLCPEKLTELMAFRNDPKQFVETRFDHCPSLEEIGDVCGIRASSVGTILDKAGLHDIVRYVYSTMEDSIYTFIHSIVPEATIVRNTFQVITPYELDIYLPDYGLAIECDPTITHNSTVAGFGPSDTPKSRSYHKMKSDLCEQQGIFLYHLFGYDWSTRPEVCKSMLASLLGATDRHIYARSCEVRDVSAADATAFLESNHRQGASVASVRLGLYLNSELVSLMTFSKPRSTISSGADWELVRFCSKLNTTVVGGASKLYNQFIRQFCPNSVVSYSDRAHTRGKLYSILGFQFQRESDPGYVWVNLKTDRAYSRVNAQKRNIAKFLDDPNIDLTKTETEIMASHGFVQVFDSGTITWLWTSRKEYING